MSSEAVEQTYELYRAKLRAFFQYKTQRRGAVDDLMQTTFLRLLSYRPPAALRNPLQYLYKVAWRVVNDANRGARQDQQHWIAREPQELTRLADQFSHHWFAGDGDELIAEDEFEQVLKEMPEVCQVVLLLQCRDGCSYKEIAQKLGVSVHTVKVYASRALNHFRRHYNVMPRGDRRNDL